MAILPLVIAPDERLLQPSTPVEAITPELRQLAADMLETMYHHQGIGLAAVQVGRHVKLIVVDVEWPSPRYEGKDAEGRTGKPIILFNAEIADESEEWNSFNEGCLSFPEQYSEVERPEHVTVRYLDVDGNPQTLRAEGILATCLQHEIDHTNGIVFVDHISKLKKNMILKRLQKAKKLGILPASQPSA